MSFMGGAPVAHDGNHRHIPSTRSYHESGGSTSVFFGPLPGRVTGISGEGRHDKQGRAMSGVLGSGARPEGGVTSKVPQVTLAFWIIKLLATTVGETGGDALSMTLGLGYAVASLIYLAFFGITLATQVASSRYRPLAYWAVVVATTTVGTTVSDFLDRSVGLGYVKSSVALSCGVLAVLALWRHVTGRIEFQNIVTKKDEIFYWSTILVSNTLGTALGDFVATTTGLGFEGGALVFAGLIALVAMAHAITRWPPSTL